MTDNMDVDQELFEDFSFGNEDILKLEQEEQLYLSQQMPSSQQIPPSQQMQTSQTTQNRHVAESNNSHLLPKSESAAADPYADPLETTIDHSGPSAPPPSTTTSSGFGPEADRIIEGLKFQLQRLEMSSASYNEKNSSKELLNTKEMLREKELQLIQLKKELYKYREKESNHEKRTFPGINVHEKSKPRKMSRPSPFSQSSTFSRSSSTPLSQQSQRSQTDPTKQPESSPTAASLFVKPKNVPNLAQLASQQQLPPPLPGIIPNRQPQAKVKKEPIIQHINLDPKKRTPPLPNKPKNDIKTKLTATEYNNKLLKVLFTPIFQKWNITKNNNNKDINMVLSRQRIKQFSDQFSQQFIPQRDQCSSTEVHNNLTLLASDICSYLSKSEHADATIRLLLNALNLCLSVCIKEKIFPIIQNIATVINILSAHFTVAARYLYKDLTFDKNSLLTQFANALILYPFPDPEPLQILLEKPDIENKPMVEIIRDVQIYNTTPTKIFQALHTVKTPKEAVVTVKCILELFYRIGSEKPAFNFLMYDENFLNLLYTDRPYEIIILALNVLETNFTDLNCMKSYNDDKRRLLIRLTDLLTCSRDALSLNDWYKLRLKSMNLLRYISQSPLPSSSYSMDIRKDIFLKTSEILEKESVTLESIQKTATNEIRKESGILMDLGMKTMYYIITQCPEDIFEYVHTLSATHVLQLVCFFQKGILYNHPANNILFHMEKSLIKYLAAHQPTF